MKHELVVRALGKQEVEAMRAMLDLFGRAFEDLETYTAKQPDDAYLIKLLGSDTFVAVAALDGTRVVGGIAGYVLQKFEQARSELYIYDLAVDDAYRRRGIAREMIEETKKIARGRGIYVIFVHADRGDAPAVALYETQALGSDVVHFDISPS